MDIDFLKDFLRYKKYQYLKLKNYNYNFKKDQSVSKYVTEIRKKGYVVIKNYLPNNECEKIIKIIDDFIKNKPNMIWRDPLGSDIRIHGAENISIEMKKLVEKKISFTKKIGEQYLNQKIDLFMMMANRTIFKNSNLGSGQGWHKDSYSKQFKSILYLCDVNEKNGPFQILKKSNSDVFMMKLFFKLKKKYPSTRFSNDEIMGILDNNKNNIEELNAKAGSLILVDTNFIHRGKPLNQDIRYALTNYFFPIRDFPNHKDHFLPKIDKVMN